MQHASDKSIDYINTPLFAGRLERPSTIAEFARLVYSTLNTVTPICPWSFWMSVTELRAALQTGPTGYCCMLSCRLLLNSLPAEMYRRHPAREAGEEVVQRCSTTGEGS